MTTQNIFQRLHAVMGEVDYIQKEKKAGMRYSIVSHDAVTAKVRPLLHKHGVVYYPVKIDRGQNGNRTEADMLVRFVNVDEPTDFIEVATTGYGIDDQDKGPGKAISYAVKYALLKTLGLETGDDPDEDQNAKHSPATQPVGNGQYRDDIGKGEAWEEWAAGDKQSDCARWLVQARNEVRELISLEDVQKWCAVAHNAKRIKALHEHHTQRYDWLMGIVSNKTDELRARAA